MTHPFLTDKQLADMLVREGQDRFVKERMWERASGRTTAAILEAMLSATRQPGTPCAVISPDDYSTQATTEHLFRLAKELCAPLPHTTVRMFRCLSVQVGVPCRTEVVIKFGGK